MITSQAQEINISAARANVPLIASFNLLIASFRKKMMQLTLAISMLNVTIQFIGLSKSKRIAELNKNTYVEITKSQIIEKSPDTSRITVEIRCCK